MKGDGRLIGPLRPVELLFGLFALWSDLFPLKHLPTLVPHTGRGIFGYYQNIGVLLVISRKIRGIFGIIPL